MMKNNKKNFRTTMVRMARTEVFYFPEDSNEYILKKGCRVMAELEMLQELDDKDAEFIRRNYIWIFPDIHPRKEYKILIKADLVK